MKKFYQFANGEEMLEMIQKGHDLYCKDLGVYVFVYNESGSICCYYLSDEEVVSLREKQRETGDYWGAFLGWGGEIFDDPSYEGYDELKTSNFEFCEEFTKKPMYWEDVTEVEE